MENKYYIIFQCSSGSLAVERYLHGYIRDNYDGALVSESGIESVAQDIRREQLGWLAAHKGKSVNVGYHRNGCTDVYHLSVGSLYLTFRKVTREIL